MALSFSDSLARAMLDAMNSHINGGPGTASLKIYSGAAPASVAAAVTNQTVLVSFTQSGDAFAQNALDKTLTVIPFDSQIASATGTASFFRIFSTGSEIPFLQGSVTVSGGTGDLQLSNVSITQGEPVKIAAMKFTMP